MAAMRSLAALACATSLALAQGPTFVYGQAKKLLYRSQESQWESQLQAEAEAFAACSVRDDYREGVTAFVEKREPQFTGR